jgi:hypothetical protein
MKRFNAGKEIEAMKRLTIHRIASSHRFIASLHRFIASVAQLCLFLERDIYSLGIDHLLAMAKQCCETNMVYCLACAAP